MMDRNASHPSPLAGGRLRALPGLIAAATALVVLSMLSAPTIASANPWSATGTPTTVRVHGLTATVLSGSVAECGVHCGKVLVVGGTNSSGTPIASAELYDPASNSWAATTPAMPAPARADHTATPLGDGRVLIAGGRDDSGTRLGTAVIYDPAPPTPEDPTWEATSNPMDEASYHHTATPLSGDVGQSGPFDAGKVLVAGGCCNASGGSLFGSELYDPVADDWTPTGLGFLNSHSGHTATLLASGPAECGSRCGMVLAVGGRGGLSPLSNSPVAPEIYDPRSQRWLPAGDHKVRRWAHTATLLEDGKVLIAGGTGGAPGLASAELYDPIAGVFTDAAPLKARRREHAAVRLADGRVLVVGGRDTSGAPELGSAELYIPPTQPLDIGSWVEVTHPMANGRAGAGYSEGPTATLLNTGKVLVVGGTSSSASAELFTPPPPSSP